MAKEWGIPPWEVDGISLTPWRRYIWIERGRLYLSEFEKKLQRNQQDMEARMKQ